MRIGLAISTMVALAGFCAALPQTASAADYTRAPFGRLSSGDAVEAITLRNAKGVTATVITYGATLQSFVGPDRNGRPGDVVLGFGDAATYEKYASYLGASVGRVANRIGGGRFTLDGKRYQLALNDHDRAALHGGTSGFDKKLWKIVDLKKGPAASVTMAYTSPDGEEGYPGTLQVTATYSLDENGGLTVDYRARTDKPTIVNITNHALFNAAGEGSPFGILNNKLMIAADAITPVDEALIPTGEVLPVAGTVFDFRSPRMIGQDVRDARNAQILLGRGYDHNFVLSGKGSLPLAARLEDPQSGRVVEVYSGQPGLQVYSGNFLDGTMVGKSGRMYRQGDGLALEPQHFPDAVNKPQFASVRLDPGQEYRNVMVFRLTTDKSR